MAQVHDILVDLDRRRRELRMPLRVLAKRSGVSLSTAQRVLEGSTNARLGTILALAETLGAEPLRGFKFSKSAEAMQREEARAKADRLAGLAQGTAALEGQAVPPGVRLRVRRRIAYKLLAGPPVRLWS